jgi:hypothetical protein
VFDLNGLISALTSDAVGMLCGGRHQVYRQDLENLLKKLSEVADLVFFDDGPIENPNKHETKTKRSEDRYNLSFKIIQKVDQEIPLQEIARNVWDVPRVKTCYPIIKETVQKFGELVVCVTKECDTEIARYANNNPSVLAVLADDTDFLIFEGNWRYFSLNQLDFESFKTLEYSRNALRSFLRLDDKQLTILSTIAGNDIINYDEVRAFHESNCGHKNDQKFPWLADYIKQMKSSSLIENIATKVLRDDSQVTKDRIKDSLNFYNTVNILKVCLLIFLKLSSQ